MSWPIRRTSSTSASSKRSISQRAAAQHRVAVLADEPQRRLAARAGLRVEPLGRLPSARPRLRCAPRPCPASLDGAHRAQRGAALVGGGAVEHQDAVEVVELVLEHARLEALGLDGALAGRGRRTRASARAAARSTSTQTSGIDRQPSSSVSRSSPLHSSTGLTRAGIGASGSARKTKTRCMTPSCVAARPTPSASSHQPGHAPHLVLERAVEALDRARATLRSAGSP